MARFLICFLLLQTHFTFGQNAKIISIDAADACTVNLSEIAKAVTPIVLENPMGMVQDILLTDEYLFLATLRSIAQYDLSGKLIRTIDCGGFVTKNVTADTTKKELYVGVGEKIKCYDYSGNLKREYSLETTSLYCLWHKGVLWAQSFNFQPDNSAIYRINKICPATGEITTLPFEWKDKPFELDNGSTIGATAASCLTLQDNEIVASFAFDNAVYKLQQDKALSLVRWNITPPAQSDVERVFLLGINGFVGNYLFINYRRNDNYYLYLENTKTGEKYNASNLVDDIYQTGEKCGINPLNQRDCFYFIKNKNVEAKNIAGKFIKDKVVIFIVKLK